ncbi:MAG: histidinol dehydrogenase, partial [Betaproteobacteria bacterium]|nr:histidinol dehydrogenase [Betaproteobacteria bacterium]
SQDESIDHVVKEIIARVRHEGDAALIEFTQRFDRWTPQTLEIPCAELQCALDTLDPKIRAALATAHQRIRAYHERQRQPSWQFTEPDGTVLGQQVTPLDRVGIYVPGGKAAYPSSVLMNTVAAKVAGVGEIIMVTPTPDGVRNETVLAAAALAGVDRVFTIGGAQAVAALAYGTASTPQVDKIVGPGNAYVAAAKRQVFGVVGIDMVAGPSEILIVADDSANAEWLAMDLLSQAEHDEIAQAILISPDAALLDRVAESLQRQLATLPRERIAHASIENRGALIEVRDLNEAIELVNTIAPEHLELNVAGAAAWLPKIRHAGAIFIGAYSSEALGDYCAGPNHVLPTARTARFSSPLGVYDFQKRSSIIQVSPVAAKALGETAATLARAEGLEAHARSAEYRFNQ